MRRPERNGTFQIQKAGVAAEITTSLIPQRHLIPRVLQATGQGRGKAQQLVGWVHRIDYVRDPDAAHAALIPCAVGQGELTIKRVQRLPVGVEQRAVGETPTLVDCIAGSDRKDGLGQVSPTRCSGTIGRCQLQAEMCPYV
jgi:hypothetical protein